MRKLYKEFNDIDFYMDEMVSNDINIDEFTKDKIKNNIKLKVKNQRRNNIMMKSGISIVAGIILFILACTNNSFIAVASDIPIVGSFFASFQDRDSNADYATYSKFIAQTKKDKGYTITINEAVLDDSKITFVYTIKSPKKLPPEDSSMNPLSFLFLNKDENPTTLNGKHYIGTAHADKKYIDDYTIQFFEEWEVNELNLPKNVDVNINITKIEDVKCNFNFNFNLSKHEINKNTRTFRPNKNLTVKDIKGIEHTLTFNEIILSPVNTTIKTSSKNDGYEFTIFRFTFKDDNGNDISWTGGGNNEDPSDSNKLIGTYNLQTLNQNVKKIYIDYLDIDTNKVYTTEIPLK